MATAESIFQTMDPLPSLQVAYFEHSNLKIAFPLAEEYTHVYASLTGANVGQVESVACNLEGQFGPNIHGRGRWLRSGAPLKESRVKMAIPGFFRELISD